MEDLFDQVARTAGLLIEAAAVFVVAFGAAEAFLKLDLERAAVGEAQPGPTAKVAEAPKAA